MNRDSVSYPDVGQLGSRANGQYPVADRVETTLLMVGAVRLGPRWNHQDLCAPFWRLYLNKRPGGRLRLPGGDVPLRPFQPCLIPPWVHFGVASLPGVEHIYLHFLTPSIPDAVLRRLWPRPMDLGRQEALAEALTGLGDAAAREEAASPAVLLHAKAALHAALGLAAAALDEAGRELLLSHLQRATPLMDLVAAIDANPADDWSVAALGRRAGCSGDHLGRLLQRHLGLSPGRLVTERRLIAAARLLASGDQSIDQVAEDCGFANRFSFTRSFTRRFGTGPAAYRRRGW